MIDVHCHFAEEGYAPEEWEKIRAAGVDKVILAADTLAHARMHSELSPSDMVCAFTVGVHPEFANGTFDETEFRWLVGRKNCVAVGEIGLDYHYSQEDKVAQRALFERQILLADAFGLPLEIHSRDACADTLAILKEHREHLRRGFLMHCYAYGPENLQDFWALGAYFSFGGVVCFRNARRAVESVAACPLERLLSETDSPYLSPFRGEKNTPANIPVIVRRLAEIKGISFEATEAAIDGNAKRLFGI